VTAPVDDEVLTAHEAADALKVHYKTLLIYVRVGELKAVKRRNRLFIRRSWLNEFLALDAA
jgi:excisionase family DNA binding protein